MADITKQVALRVPTELLTRIDERARKVGLSRNGWLVKALGWAVEQPVKTVTVKQDV